jgi:pimeloyl-ACP methyl ester carboxylesterase
VTRPAGTPTATLALFTGGDGKLRNYGPPDLGRGKFLVRSRELFVAEGFAVAVVDAPSDQPDGMRSFVTSKERASDIAAVVAWLGREIPAPVWLVGTSRGSISAALGAKAPGVAGVVLTSSVLRESRNMPGSIFDVSPEQIRVPTLVVHHRDDQCPVCPFEDTRFLMSALKQAPRRELIAMSGGDPPRSEPCQALSVHGYLGIERETVAAIAAWIKRP